MIRPGAFCLAGSRARKGAVSKPELREKWTKEQKTATPQVVANFAWSFAKVKELWLLVQRGGHDETVVYN